ncbi:ATP-binding protein [Streptomyces lavendulocolor]|uniref:ATP-binding protein n=1 Tax=Streptomyces lavendulocolor TaxID=67316 RepID=UPI00340608AC
MNRVDQPSTLPSARDGEGVPVTLPSGPGIGSHTDEQSVTLSAQSICVTLRAETRSVPVARAMVRELLTSCGAGLTDETLDTSTLLVTELFTNAVVHSNATAILLSLVINDGHLRIDVTDNGSSLRDIRERSTSTTDEHGRGLLLVRKLSQNWGKETSRSGTKVWAVFPLRNES